MKHSLKSPSSFIVVVLSSTMHKACVRCGKPLKSFEEAARHWEEELGWEIDPLEIKEAVNKDLAKSDEQKTKAKT